MNNPAANSSLRAQIKITASAIPRIFSLRQKSSLESTFIPMAPRLLRSPSHSPSTNASPLPKNQPAKSLNGNKQNANDLTPPSGSFNH